MWCQNCRTFIPAGATVCPGCHKPIAEVAPEEAPRQAVAPLDPAAAAPRAAPPAAAAPGAANTPWMGMNFGGPPSTASAPYNPNQPQAGAYGGYTQPNYQQGVNTSWPARPAREEPVFLGLTRRDLLAGGAGGVAGLLLGAGGAKAADALITPAPAVAPAQFWAYATGGGGVSVTINKTGAPGSQTVPIPGGATVVTSRTAADTLALVTGLNGVWTLWYWTPDLLRGYPSLRLLGAKTLVLTLETGPVGQVFDVRALTDQTGATVAIAVAMIDAATGAPQLALARISDGSHSQPAVPYKPGAAPITDISVVGPFVMPADGALYVRISTGASIQVAPVSISRLAATPTPPPIATSAPKTIPTNTPTGTATAKPGK